MTDLDTTQQSQTRPETGIVKKEEDANANKNTTPLRCKGTLLLTSHAHSPPLQPPSHLKFDLRAVENPPKALRDSHTGLSKRLREHLLGHRDFVELLDRAEGEIRDAMARYFEGGDGLGAMEGDHDGGTDEDEEGNGDVNGSRADAEGDSGEHEDGKGRFVLSVAAFCARGHHRSVAFVGELAGRKWPAGWEVRVVHRDLGRAREGRKHGRGKGMKGGGFDIVEGW